MTMHKKYRSKYPNREIRGNKAEDLKRNLRSRQAIFPKPKPINTAKVLCMKLRKSWLRRRRPLKMAM
jgi:hypothetical protein